MRKQIRGFTLLEVMIAVLIVAVGILGVAGLQVISLQQNRNALLRDQALQAGNDLMDRMRANFLTSYEAGLDDPPASSFNCVNSNCTQAEMAEFDIAQWKCQINPLDDDSNVYSVCAGFNILTASLPGGKGSVTGEPPAVAEVTIQWISSREGQTTSVVLRTQARGCIPSQGCLR